MDSNDSLEMMVWDQFLFQLEQEWGRDLVDRWVRSLKLSSFDAGNLYLEAKDHFQINWFEEHVRPKISHLMNPNGRPLRIHLSLPKQLSQSKEKHNSTPSTTFSNPLDPEMTLENFIPSSHNQLALELISSKSPFNPVLFYGPKGCGKTHLLMAAAAALRSQDQKICYIHAEKFTEHVVQAIQQGSMQCLRKTYRSVDCFIVDDIHHLARKGATQEEFFHTFNELHTRGCSIFLSAACAPAKLTEIEPRLISRFEWGITIGLEKIDLALILAKKAAIWKIPISPTLIPFLIETFPSSPLIALQALAIRIKGPDPIDPLLAKRILQDLLKKEASNAWTIEKIIQTLSTHYGIKKSDLLGKSQTREASMPRQLAMYLCREKLKLPFQKIGEIFDRDHSTVITSVRQIQRLINEKNSELEDLLALFP